MISLEQALASGLSHDAVRRRVARREWRAVGPRVYQLAGHQETPGSRTIAAMLSVGPDATLVGRSAAWWWGMGPAAPAAVEVAVSPPRQPRSRVGLSVRRRGVAEEDRTTVRGLAVTKRAPSVLDAAARLGLEEGARLMDTVLQSGRVGLPALRSAHLRTAGRHGAPLGRELLALADGGARSQAERETHVVLRRADIAGWEPNVVIDLPGFGRAVGDIVLHREKIVVEIDGWAYHRDLRAFLRDGPRQSALVAAGWVVLRTHWYEIREEPAVFVSRLRRTIASRS